jgi:hypothetical protein
MHANVKKEKNLADFCKQIQAAIKSCLKLLILVFKFTNLILNLIFY